MKNKLFILLLTVVCFSACKKESTPSSNPMIGVWVSEDKAVTYDIKTVDGTGTGPYTFLENDKIPNFYIDITEVSTKITKRYSIMFPDNNNLYLTGEGAVKTHFIKQ